MRRLSRLCVPLAVCAAAAACGEDAPAPSASPTTTPTDNVTTPPVEAPRALTGGTVTVRVSTGPQRILDYAGVRLTTRGDARGADGELTFPITRGRLAVAPVVGAIELGGALRISARGDHVDATALRVDPAGEVVTAVIEGRRVPLLRFRLRYPRALPGTAEGTVSVVGDRALERLASGLDVEVLREGLPLGTMRLSAR